MRCLALLALLALATPVQASIILSAGQSATFNFYTMPLLDEFHNQPIVEAHIFFGIDELTPGELVQLDLYEELNATGTPFVTSNPPIGAPGPTQVINQTQFGDYWNDHNGSLTHTGWHRQYRYSLVHEIRDRRLSIPSRDRR